MKPYATAGPALAISVGSLVNLDLGDTTTTSGTGLGGTKSD